MFGKIIRITIQDPEWWVPSSLGNNCHGLTKLLQLKLLREGKPFGENIATLSWNKGTRQNNLEIRKGTITVVDGIVSAAIQIYGLHLGGEDYPSKEMLWDQWYRRSNRLPSYGQPPLIPASTSRTAIPNLLFGSHPYTFDFKNPRGHIFDCDLRPADVNAPHFQILYKPESFYLDFIQIQEPQNRHFACLNLNNPAQVIIQSRDCRMVNQWLFPVRVDGHRGWCDLIYPRPEFPYLISYRRHQVVRT